MKRKKSYSKPSVLDARLGYRSVRGVPTFNRYGGMRLIPLDYEIAEIEAVDKWVSASVFVEDTDDVTTEAVTNFTYKCSSTSDCLSYFINSEACECIRAAFPEGQHTYLNYKNGIANKVLSEIGDKYG